MKTLAIVFQSSNAEDYASALDALENAHIPFAQGLTRSRATRFPFRKFRILVDVTDEQLAREALNDIPTEYLPQPYIQTGDADDIGDAEWLPRLLWAVVF